MSAAITQSDLANVAHLLERILSGDSILATGGGTPVPPNDEGAAMLQRVREYLRAGIRRMDDPLGDGGPAFPIPFDDRPGSYEPHPGMTLRDYFAAQFMERAQSLSETREGGWDFQNAAQCCYAMADAMLKARGTP